MSIFFVPVSVLLLVFSIVPFYKYSSYDYSNVTPQNPTPAQVTGNVSILVATFMSYNPISIICIVLSIVSIILSTLNFGNFQNKTKKILEICTIIVFAVSFIAFVLSFGFIVSIIQSGDFHLNFRT